MLECSNVVKKYTGKTAVDGVSLTLGEGRLVALLGPNGSGKTTLMKMIAGLTRPTSGSIKLDGQEIGVETKKQVAYMPTEAYFYNYMTAMDAGRYYRDFFKDFSIEKYLTMLENEKLDVKQKVRSMSSGMMAKMKLCLTFARDSKLIMLDEPLNGIDIIARERTLSMIRSHLGGERTLIVSSHLVDELESMIDDVVFMKDGAAAYVGTAEALREETGLSVVEMYMRVYGEIGGEANA